MALYITKAGASPQRLGDPGRCSNPTEHRLGVPGPGGDFRVLLVLVWSSAPPFLYEKEGLRSARSHLMDWS